MQRNKDGRYRTNLGRGRWLARRTVGRTRPSLEPSTVRARLLVPPRRHRPCRQKEPSSVAVLAQHFDRVRAAGIGTEAVADETFADFVNARTIGLRPLSDGLLEQAARRNFLAGAIGYAASRRRRSPSGSDQRAMLPGLKHQTALADISSCSHVERGSAGTRGKTVAAVRRGGYHKEKKEEIDYEH